jgi:hypothetical protein
MAFYPLHSGPSAGAAANSSDWLLHSIVIALLLLLFAPAPGKAAPPPINEQKVKTAFIYNFSRFTQWPEVEFPGGKLSLCIIGIDSLATEIDTLAGKDVQGHTIEVRMVQALNDIDGCHIAYISYSESGNLQTVLDKLRHKPVLTISNLEGFTGNGGIIRLRLVENKVRFDINVDAATQAGLVISSKLLSLATIVRGDP